MGLKEFKKAIRGCYSDYDVAGFLKALSDFKKEPDFKRYYRQLVQQQKITPGTTDVTAVVNVLVMELEQAGPEATALMPGNNFYDVAEYLKLHFNSAVSEAYLETQMPGEFVLRAREGAVDGGGKRLTETMVEQYKQELMRIDVCRDALNNALESCSHFPRERCIMLSKSLSKLIQQLRELPQYDEKLKSLVGRVVELGGVNSKVKMVFLADSDQTLAFVFFQRCLEKGTEPTFHQMVAFHVAIKRLFGFIKENRIITEEEFKLYWGAVRRFLSYRSSVAVATEARPILVETLEQIGADHKALMKRLSETFVEEYQSAEDLMMVRYRVIETELLYTKEYLTRIQSEENISDEQDKRIELAAEKVCFLQDIFPTPGWKMELAHSANMLDLERSAFGVSAEITPKQLTDWIRIYAILFSNSDLVEQTDKEINFLVMRQLISNLTTYHLVQNITQLKRMVNTLLAASTEDVVDRIHLFHEALKIKLLGLIHPTQGSRKTFQAMIDELGFIKDEKRQYLIADTFKGFQHIADAFTEVANDYFIKDQAALHKESQELYNDICNQCMRGMLVRNKHRRVKRKPGKGDSTSKPWFSRVFAS
ncbi:MAG: hypothetical protein AB2813_03490 [Candidatus Sedimenticola endophacoides]